MMQSRSWEGDSKSACQEICFHVCKCSPLASVLSTDFINKEEGWLMCLKRKNVQSTVGFKCRCKVHRRVSGLWNKAGSWIKGAVHDD